MLAFVGRKESSRRSSVFTPSTRPRVDPDRLETRVRERTWSCEVRGCRYTLTEGRGHVPRVEALCSPRGLPPMNEISIEDRLVTLNSKLIARTPVIYRLAGTTPRATMPVSLSPLLVLESSHGVPTPVRVMRITFARVVHLERGPVDP